MTNLLGVQERQAKEIMVVLLVAMFLHTEVLVVVVQVQLVPEDLQVPVQVGLVLQTHILVQL
jgi:hypothetical protein